jgi:hypothetical protein
MACDLSVIDRIKLEPLLSTVNRDSGNIRVTGLGLPKEFDMKYVAGYHEDNRVLNSLFLWIKVGSRNQVFQPLIFRPN